nr:plasmid recombination protein [Rhodovulum sulfidophilum]
MKQNAPVIMAGIITFGTVAAESFGSLPVEQQDAAFRELATAVASELDTSLESLMVHLDETTIHAHFTLRAYTNAGLSMVDQIDAEMAARAYSLAEGEGTLWQALLAEGSAYIEMALDREVQRIVLRDGPAVLGDPARWPSQNRCLDATRDAVRQLLADGVLRPVDIEAASRLLNGAAFNAALWIASYDNQAAMLPKAQEAFRMLAEGLLALEFRTANRRTRE